MAKKQILPTLSPFSTIAQALKAKTVNQLKKYQSFLDIKSKITPKQEIIKTIENSLDIMQLKQLW